MALLDDPFSHRPSALAAAELDEARLQSLIESWRMRFEGDAKGELGERYVAAYSARRAALHAARERPTDGTQNPSDPRFLSKEALGFREEAALVGRHPGAESASPPFSAQPAPAAFAAPTAAPPRVEPSGVFSAPRLTPEPPPPAIAPPPIPSAPRPNKPPSSRGSRLARTRPSPSWTSACATCSPRMTTIRTTGNSSTSLPIAASPPAAATSRATSSAKRLCDSAPRRPSMPRSSALSSIWRSATA